MWLDDVAAGAVSSGNEPPLHSQLSSLLRGSMADGSLPPGSQLPTEAELQHKFGISRSVVRQALAVITDEGLIQRGRGKGSVVAPHHEHHRQVQRMPGLSAQISTSDAPVSTEVLSLAPGADARAEAALGTSDLLALRRRRSAEGEVIAIIQTWLPRSLAGSLTAEELADASLHATLASRFGVPVTAGRRQIRAVPASEQLAREMALAVGAPLLLLEGTSLDDQGRPAEYFSTWHRADRVVFDLDATAEAPSNAALAARVQSLAAELQSLSALLK
jgi:GntR family transcriptional regulator